MQYINLNGDKKAISSCMADRTKYYKIAETTIGCENRVDTTAKKAWLQKRKFYNDGKKAIYISECYDTGTSFAFRKSKEACTQKLSQNRQAIVEQEETYYIDGNGVKKVVLQCAPNGVETTVKEEEKARDYGKCGVFADYGRKKVYRQYETYIALNGSRQLLGSCTPDYAGTSYDIGYDYGPCEVKIDLITGKAILMRKLFYRTGGEDKYLTKCIESNISYPILANDTDCPKLAVRDSNKLIFQRSLYYVDKDKTMVTVKACYPTDKSGMIGEVLCDLPWVHDMKTRQSYRRTKFRYFDGKGKEVIVKPCQYSVNYPSYPHREESCGVRHDDTKLKSYIKTRTHIELEDKSKLYITNCGTHGSPIPYTYKETVVQRQNLGAFDAPTGCQSSRYYLVPSNDQGSYREVTNSYRDLTKGTYICGDNTQYEVVRNVACVRRVNSFRRTPCFSTCRTNVITGSYSCYRCGWYQP